jgi:hypothetical protein
MENIDNIQKKVLSLKEDINKEFTNACDRLSAIDKRLSDVYHRIEGAELSHVSEAYDYMIELQEILRERRNIKLIFLKMSLYKQILSDKFDDVDKKIIETDKKHNELLIKMSKS